MFRMKNFRKTTIQNKKTNILPHAHKNSCKNTYFQGCLISFRVSTSFQESLPKASIGGIFDQFWCQSLNYWCCDPIPLLLPTLFGKRGIVKKLNIYIMLLCAHFCHSSFWYLSITCNTIIACYIRRQKNYSIFTQICWAVAILCLIDIVNLYIYISDTKL